MATKVSCAVNGTFHHHGVDGICRYHKIGGGCGSKEPCPHKITEKKIPVVNSK